MDRNQMLSLFDEQQRIGMEFPGTRKEVTPHVVRFVRPLPGRSTLLYSHFGGEVADSIIQEQIAFYTALGSSFTWKVYSHDTPSDLVERLVQHGFEASEPEDVMLLDLNSVPAILHEPITAYVRPITTREQLADVVRVEEQVWGGNFDWIPGRLGSHLEIPGYLSVYVAYVEGEPASAGWTYFHSDSSFASLWGGSTVPGYRKRGLYTALLAIRVQEAIRRGYQFLVIDTSPMSRPIVARHGFQFLTSATDCDWDVEAGSAPA
jgi:hypothetical protein